MTSSRIDPSNHHLPAPAQSPALQTMGREHGPKAAEAPAHIQEYDEDAMVTIENPRQGDVTIGHKLGEDGKPLPRRPAPEIPHALEITAGAPNALPAPEESRIPAWVGDVVGGGAGLACTGTSTALGFATHHACLAMAANYGYASLSGSTCAFSVGTGVTAVIALVLCGVTSISHQSRATAHANYEARLAAEAQQPSNSPDEASGALPEASAPSTSTPRRETVAPQ